MGAHIRLPSIEFGWGKRHVDWREVSAGFGEAGFGALFDKRRGGELRGKLKGLGADSARGIACAAVASVGVHHATLGAVFCIRGAGLEGGAAVFASALSGEEKRVAHGDLGLGPMGLWAYGQACRYAALPAVRPNVLLRGVPGLGAEGAVALSALEEVTLRRSLNFFFSKDVFRMGAFLGL